MLFLGPKRQTEVGQMNQQNSWERTPGADRIASKRSSTTDDKVVYQNTQPGLGDIGDDRTNSLIHPVCENSQLASLFGLHWCDWNIQQTFNYNGSVQRSELCVHKLFLLDEAGLNKGPPMSTNTGSEVFSLRTSCALIYSKYVYVRTFKSIDETF